MYESDNLRRLEPFGTKSLDVEILFSDIALSMLDRLKLFLHRVSIQNLEIKRDNQSDPFH